MKFNELVRLLEQQGFRIVKEKGSIRYYGNPGFGLIIMVQRRFQKALVMLYYKQQV